MPAIWSAPVRYAECDQQGIVFNAHYLTWCDEAMNTWYASTGHAYPDVLARGLDARLVSSTLEWASSARWGEVVEVAVETERIGRTSFVLAFTVQVGERVCCRVRTTYVMVDEQGTPTPVPDDLRADWSS